jgi:acetoin utilization protein AcuB
MKVREIMHRHATIIASTSTVGDIWKLIFQKHINAVPIVDNTEKLIGIITKDDLLKLLYPNFSEYLSNITTPTDFEEMEEKSITVRQKKAIDVMCKKVIFTREDTECLRALSRMIVRHVDQLPVLSVDNQVIGMITKGDIFYALFKNKIQPADRKAAKLVFKHKK